MILACNTESFLSLNHDDATLVLKQSTGVVRLLVDNPKEEVEARETGVIPGKEPKEDAQPQSQGVEETKGEKEQKVEEDAAAKKSDQPRKSLAPPEKPEVKAASPAKSPAKKSPAKAKDDGKVEMKIEAGKSLGITAIGGSDTDLVAKLSNIFMKYYFICTINLLRSF